MELSIIGYDPVGAWMKTPETLDELLAYCNPGGNTWINLDGLGDGGEVTRLASHFGVHPLTVEDILDTDQRPKAEEFDNYIFITVKAINPKVVDDSGYHVIEQISMILMEDMLITFQEIPGDAFDGIRKRILNNAGRIRKMSVDYLAYLILDAIADSYLSVLEQLGGAIEDFEERAVDVNDASFMKDLQNVKRRLLRLRRVIWPFRESVALLMRMDSKFLPDEMTPFLKDVNDSVVQSVETIETYRELIAGLMDIRLSMNSNSMNNVMKVLTIISTIFIPLTFVVGVYGMNFHFMPELDFKWAYPICWGVMIVIAVVMLFIFRRRKWL
jgi:magnesium transporter